jgi:uncharacterized protein YcfJ
MAAVSALLMVAGCAQTPMGPRVQVMPAANKPFEVFQQDQATCKQYANDQVAGQADSANTRALGAALLGAGLGAGLGAAVGGGHGAGVGAAAGGVAGTAIGASNSEHTQGGIQQQYDNAYSQCMASKGNQVVAQPVRTIVQPTVVYTAPPPPTVVYTAPPPTVVYTAPPGVVYAPPPGAVYAPPAGASVPATGYAPPAGAATPPPNTPAPAAQ